MHKGGLVSQTLLSIVYYGVCSSILLVANKVAIFFIPKPGLVFTIQLTACTATVLVLKAVGVLNVDAFTWIRVQKFLPYILAFAISVYANGKALEHSNVETVITFRACSPLLVSFLDWLVLGRELPSQRSALALLGVVAGAIGYMYADSEFMLVGVQAYMWDIVYLVGIVFEMTYGKYLLSGIKFDTPVWGSVLYTNALGLPPMLLLSLASGELKHQDQSHLSLSASACGMLALTCVAGIGISWAGWNCRSKLSATSYTLLGVSCKLVSVLLNACIWEKHATALGVFWLVLCLLSSTMYQQAPMRSSKPQTELLKVNGEP